MKELVDGYEGDKRRGNAVDSRFVNRGQEETSGGKLRGSLDVTATISCADLGNEPD